MIELRWKKVKKDSPGSLIVITPEDMFAAVVLQYREGQKATAGSDTTKRIWSDKIDWTDWQDVDISDG
jgi:hypothetical protein